MNLHKQIIDDVQLSGKRVIIRADFNVPLDDARSSRPEWANRSGPGECCQGRGAFGDAAPCQVFVAVVSI